MPLTLTAGSLDRSAQASPTCADDTRAETSVSVQAAQAEPSGLLSGTLRSSLEAAYRSHGPSVQRRARSILGNEADAREVVQELFTSLLARPEQFSGQGSLMAFLYRATTNLCLNRLRNARNRLRLLDERGPPERSQAPRAENRAFLCQLLARLADDQAQAVIYYYLDEMSHNEIAALLGCSRRHVGNLLERARAGLAAQEKEKAHR